MKAIHSLKDSDWLFTKAQVPDHELVHCLLWEYHRESATVRQLALDWFAWFSKGPTPTSDQEQTALWARMKKLEVLVNSPLKIDNFLSQVVVQGFGLNQLLDCPWQQLNPDSRKAIIEGSTTNPPVYLGHVFPHLSILTESLKSRCNEDPFVLAKAMMPELAPGKEVLLVVVDWGLYDDNSVKDAFKHLGDNLDRPKGIKPQVRKASGLGRAAEWRGKLNDLGVARLSRYHARQLKEVEPRAYEFLATTLSDVGPTAVENKMASSRRRFKTSFREILPFEHRIPHCLSIPRFTR